MPKRIIYPTPEGGVTILTPAPEYMETHTLEELIAKDVPEGVEFKIIDTADVPTDRTFRNAWEYQA